MKVLIDGYKYEMDNFEPGSPFQTIQFIHKVTDIEFGELGCVVIRNGSTNEDIINILIHRLRFQYDRLPAKETLEAIDCLVCAQYRLKSRGGDMTSLGPEGKSIR